MCDQDGLDGIGPESTVCERCQYRLTPCIHASVDQDDLIATGGTIYAATKLVESLGGEIVECAFIVELPDLHGKEKIAQYPIFTLTEFEGE